MRPTDQQLRDACRAVDDDLMSGTGYAQEQIAELRALFEPERMSLRLESEPIRMLLWCPECGARHIDEGEFATKPHHTHACQSCGMVWRPAIEPTCGVAFLPGFKNKEPAK